MTAIRDFLLKLLEWIGSSAFRLFTVITLLFVTAIGWFLYEEKDAFMASYKASQALPKMNGDYEKAVGFILKNTEAEMIAIFEVNTLLNTRKLVYMTSRKSGRVKSNDGLDVGLLTKNHSNNQDVISLMSGSIPCGVYTLPQSQIGFVYKDMGVNYMCRISVPYDPGTFIGQISIGWKEEPADVDKAKTVLTVASGMLYNPKQ
jgi:hypothetical protein